MKRGTGLSRKGMAAALAALLFLPGCFSEDKGQPLAEKREKEAAGGLSGGEPHAANTLRIGILTGEAGDRYYRETYTDIYEYNHPELNIEIVPAVDTARYRYLDPDSEHYQEEDPLDELKKLTEGEHPVDVLILDPEALRRATQNGWTEPLASYMESTGESEEEFAPAVIGGLKDLGGGELHALAPDYASSALYYNVDWFERSGVKPPEDGMTWDEAFARARAASGENESGAHVYGLSFTQAPAEDPLWAIRTYTEPLGLSTFDLQTEEMTVDTPEWLDVWTKLADMTRQGAVPLDLKPETDPDSYDPFGGDLFLSGRAAMTIADSSYAGNLQTAARNAERIERFDPFRWKTVALPVHPGRESIGAGVKLGDTFSIVSSSSHKAEAWDFIRFATGERIQAMGLHDTYRMPSRLKAIAREAEENGYRSEAFTRLRPAEPIAEREDRAVQDNPQLWQIGDSGRKLFQRVLQGELPVKQALEQWENDGRRWLKGPFTEDGTLTFGAPPPPGGPLAGVQIAEEAANLKNS
ncbi:extracellular solute-binding protein [Saccharibacillus alkalitolerans]|uniref:Extracellular solute-binding protein n=1 Tax=Saccharibacillus alkalitolerans TaxID=2705290 RepID=A0ABX0F214_9BACL|nr:extracellular solute-binding protein [Saccharibacillus alkalitolerans]NGZ73905.1 extracellular solute-binding protein [Saccharibacillus alkalitolerans]